ncbi:cohesin domain-containing protein [Methylomonas koyamae]|uniref:cohesin domain-containing protein n=1 Tax=Methylomonas koyamae TaxID=702114 RepID=UPI001C3277EA|nr:cohesin domain-containing protein [Methylomonas koyamae]BBL60895.1 hypothetical protein MKFW12EY_45080 [Methylomonas koyamae]
MFKKQFQRSLLLFALALPAQASVVISLNTDTPQIQVGDNVSFAVNISRLDAAVALSSYDLSVNFDPALLQFDHAIFGDSILGDQLDIAQSGLNFPSVLAGDGLVSLIEFSLDDSSVLLSQQANDFTLARLFFTAISTGISPLNLTIISLADHDAKPLIADSNNSSVSIAAVPIPPAIWTFISPLALFMRKRGKLQD